jgi:hypothetical protein
MTVVPIYNAIELVRMAIVPALTARSGGRTVYWLQAGEGAAYPFVVVQSQDDGGAGVPNLGSLGWSGLITVKVLAQANGNNNPQAAAEALMATIAPGMDALTAPTLYDLSVIYQRPAIVPPSQGVWQCAHIWRVTLERE